MVPWIIDNPGSTIAEIADRFGQTQAQVMKTLETLSFVGVPPYSPDALIEVRIDEDRVSILFADYFSKPLQLSTGQALALLSSADALRRIEGADADGSLNSALQKLADATGVTPDRQLDIRLGDAPSDRLSRLRGASEEGDELKITYFNQSKNETDIRIIAPRRVRSAGGAWYVDAYCRTARDDRTFRLDRILSIESIERGFEPVPDAELSPPGTLFRSHGEMPTVTLRLGQAQHWVKESIPIVRLVEIDPQTIDVTLAVASRAFLERLLLQLGPSARVIESDALTQSGDTADELAAAAARRVLANYAD
jgi:proteasome accessory factor C